MKIKSAKENVSKQGFILLLILLVCSFGQGVSAEATELRSNFTSPAIGASTYDIDTLHSELYSLKRSPKLIVEIDRILDSLDESAPAIFPVELKLWKLDTLVKINESKVAAEYATEIYSKHPRKSFASDIDYGNTLYQIVESLAKTDSLGLAYDIIQHLRIGLYSNPNTYLSFIVEKSLIEVYMETSDYQRALKTTLSILDNADYMKIEEVQDWRPTAINEIAYLYNKLGDGEKALSYLEEVAQALKTKDQTQKKVKKAWALNFANRGRAYLHLKDYEQARAMGKRVQEANQDLRQKYLTAVSYRIMGCADFLAGEYQSAKRNLSKGIELAQEGNSLSLKRELYYEYSMTLEKLGQYQSSAYWLRELFELEIHRQETIAATRSKLNEIEFSAFKDHQEMRHLHHELRHSQSMNKTMLLAIFSLFAAGCILTWLLWNLRKNQKKLVESEMKAQVASQAKSDFLANMSHEIRTPMNGVLGMAQVLEKTPLSHQQKFYLDIIKRSGHTLLDLINDILDFSKIEADKLTLNYECCDLDQTLQDIVRLLTPNAVNKNIEIRYSYPPDLPKFFSLDSKRIRQIVMNLVGNAVKFTTEGHVTVRVDGWVNENTADIRISVADTGIGIQSSELSTIFQKFTQVGESSNRFYGGTGLGLAISHKLTKAMKGELSVASDVGKGSIFTLNLPAEIMSSASRAQEQPQLVPASQAA